jgi:YjjG family noncanonical pyrimidine nucleotidase
VAYSAVLIDLDHTLLDSRASETEAFRFAMKSHGIDATADSFDTYRRINRALWAAVERNEVTPDEVRIARFDAFIEELGVDADPAAVAATFTTGLGNFGELYVDAIDVLDTLSGSARLALLTNGLSDVQRARIRRLGIERYFDAIVISAEVSASKPGAEIFDRAFASLAWPDRRSTLMVGDSLTSDIKGGADYGIDTCWYNPNRHPRPTSPRVTHEIRRLSDLPAIVADPREASD